jgi:hypothetical protein
MPEESGLEPENLAERWTARAGGACNRYRERSLAENSHQKAVDLLAINDAEYQTLG